MKFVDVVTSQLCAIVTTLEPRLSVLVFVFEELKLLTLSPFPPVEYVPCARFKA